MSDWLDRAEAILDNELYPQVPDVACKGLCADSCGPIDMGPVERLRIKRAGARITPRTEANRLFAETGGTWRCPALSDDNRCTVYQVRPMVCRVWGAGEELPCPHGCQPADGERLLSNAEMYALLDAALRAGTNEEPLSVAEFELVLKDPRVEAMRRRLLPPASKNRRGKR